MLRREIAFDDLLDVLVKDRAHVRKAVEEKNAVSEAIGVVHLLNRFLSPELGHFQKA